MAVSLERLIDAARKLGARAVELLVVEDDGVVVTCAKGKITRQDAFTTTRARATVWDAAARSAAVEGTLVELPALIERALAAAADAPIDAEGAPVARLSAPIGGLSIDDKRHSTLTMADRIEVISAAERGARQADKRAQTENFAYRDNRRRRRIANSRGLNLEEWSTLYQAMGSVLVGDERGNIAMSDHLASRAFASIASLPYGAALAQRAAALLPGHGAPPGPQRVVFSPRSLAELVLQLGDEFTWANLDSGDSFLAQAAREHRPLFDPRVTLLDDGTVPGSIRTRAFDDRGVPPATLALLREGRVDGRFIDVATARRKEARPTGHQWRRALAPNNLILRGGTRSINAILSEMDRQILVIDHVYDWNGLNLKTGDLTIRAGGWMTRRSKHEHFVRDVKLSGHLPTVLTNIVEIASDTDRYLHVDAPAMILDGFVILP